MFVLKSIVYLPLGYRDKRRHGNMGETPCPVELGGQKYAHISVASAIVQNQAENIGYLRKKSNIVRSLFRMCVLTLAARQKTLFTLAAKWRSESGQG